MTARSFLLALSALSLAPLAALAASDQNSFTLVNNGHTVGRASYTIDKVKEGFRVRSKLDYHVHRNDIPELSKTAVTTDDVNTMDATAGSGHGRTGGAAMNGASSMLDGQETFEYKVSPDGHFLGGYLQDGGSQTMTSFTPDKTGATLTIGRVQAGSSDLTNQLPMPSTDYLFAPDFDPAGIQMLFRIALEHPRADKKYMLFIPGYDLRDRPKFRYVAMDPALADTAAGTLDGKPITLKHFPINFQTGRGDVYLDENGNLMEADITRIGTSYIRAKFTLTR